MDFKNISNFELSQRLEKLVRTERRITHLILLHINEVESRRLYAEAGYDGMFAYLTKCLGYSESSAYRRLQSARLLKQIPSVAEKLESGALNLSQLTQVQKCLREEKKSTGTNSLEKTEKILLEIEHKNTFETQKVLAGGFDHPVQLIETIKPQADESVRLEITLTPNEFSELQKAKELLSHICPHGSWSDVISTLARKFNKSKLGNEVQPNGSLTSKPDRRNDVGITTIFPRNSKRPYISIKTKRALFAFANYCCQFKDKSGNSCGSTYQLQIDHVFPKALGGSDKPENLRILCRTHNNLMAKEFELKSFVTQ
ncbi:HNH endonuclease [Bdellovibrio bacteriovorus]